MATSTYGTPYVQGSDLVSAYPTASSNLATRVDEVSYKRNGLNAQTGTTYTLVAGDAGKTITLSNAAAVAVTLPQDSVATLPTGAVVSFYNLGAGAVTISQGTGATLQGGSITLAQYEVTSVIKLSANTYGRYDGAPAPGLTSVSATSIANTTGSASQSGGAITFTGVTVLNINGIFTSTYDNYKIVCTGISSSSTSIDLRLRSAGTDYTSANYARQSLIVASTSVTASRDTAATAGRFCDVNTTGSAFTAEIFRPYVADTTLSISQWQRTLTAPEYGAYASALNTTGQYDGFTIQTSGGVTITGVIRVYGFKNS